MTKMWAAKTNVVMKNMNLTNSGLSLNASIIIRPIQIIILLSALHKRTGIAKKS